MTETQYRIPQLRDILCRKFLLCRIAIILCCILWLFPGAVFAAPQRFILETPVLVAVAGTLYADCSLSVDDEDGLRDLLKDGAVLELRISTEVERRRSWWSNADLGSGVFVSALRHDPLTREFLLTLPGDGRETLHRDRNLTRLLYATWRKLRLPILAEQAFPKGRGPQDYLITLTFELRHTELPPWLEKSPGFWSSDVVPQERRELEYHR